MQGALNQSAFDARHIFAVAAQIPKEWEVKMPDGEVRISAESLRMVLLESATQTDSVKRKEQIQQARDWLADLAGQAEDYSKNPGVDAGEARRKAEAILRRPEFSAEHKQTARDLFRQRVRRWFQSLLNRLLSGIERHPVGGRILLWFLIVGMVALLGLLLFRLWIGRTRFEELKAESTSLPARSWQEWLRASRRAADGGNFREAIHAAYWAGVAFLQARGALPADRTHTPREYLRLLNESPFDGSKPDNNRKASLAALTTRLERVWYGYRAATAEDFQESLNQLKVLGCES